MCGCVRVTCNLYTDDVDASEQCKRRGRVHGSAVPHDSRPSSRYQQTQQAVCQHSKRASGTHHHPYLSSSPRRSPPHDHHHAAAGPYQLASRVTYSRRPRHRARRAHAYWIQQQVGSGRWPAAATVIPLCIS